jgi:signal transduction histidine kinase
VTRRPRGLAARLLAAQLLVIAAGAVTLVLAALAAGPPLFRAHVKMALGTVSPALERHLDGAFADAAGIALGIGTAAAVTAAVAVSLLITRRLARPLRDLGQAAADVAAGDYTTRTQRAGLGPELDALCAAFNTMAAALQATEATRRRLLADAAHELRTPLATLNAYLEGLADGIRAPGQDTWDIMAAQTARLQRLADDITLVSRAEEGQLPIHLARVAPGDLVTAAVAAARPGYDAKGVHLAARVADGLPEISADPDRIGQVLAGLLANALRHTPPGGSVRAAVAVRDGKDVQITVMDTGDGIAPEHLPHVFERFYRADSARDAAHGGSGIGLTIVRALVAAHGGTITAASDGPGAGSCFTITLSASRPRAASAGVARRS